MNFEICATVDALKYPSKYVDKNNNCVKVALKQSNNNVKCYLLGSYIRFIEGIWHIMRIGAM